MLERLAADTSVIIYLMAAFGAVGILSKVVNHFTLRRLVKAAGNMPKSTHRLIKLVRAKYEHACMIHDSVDNIGVFVDKYIYEYRGFLFRMHTWRQMERLSVWFAGILGALGAALCYLSSGFNESVYQYIACGIAEVVLLSVFIRLSDEDCMTGAVRMYMVDYLDNICTFRLRRQKQTERESIDVISAEGSQRQSVPQSSGMRGRERAEEEQESAYACAGSRNAVPGYGQSKASSGEGAGIMRTEQGAASEDKNRLSGKDMSEEENELPINIEGEPRRAGKGEAVREVLKKAMPKNRSEERPAIREEAIRQILEEFLA